MINIKLLKKGSHVQIEDNDYQIYSIISDSEVEATLLPGGPPDEYSIENLQPISITDGYLAAYKLKKDTDGKFHSRGNIIYRQGDGKWTILTLIKPDVYEAHPDLEFIHELQFYSMENTEEDLQTFGQF